MKNRWGQLAASLLAMIMIANLQYAWTLFVSPLRAAHPWKLSDIQWAFTLFIIFETWVMPVEGWLIDRAGPRLFTSIAGVLCGFGWAGLAYADTLWKLYAFYAVAGTGAAFVYSGAIAGAIKWFPDRRGLAAGIIAGGFGAGSALFIPVFSWMIRDYGYRTAFLISGIVQGLVILTVAQVLRHPPATAATASSKLASGQFSTAQMLRTPKFYVLYLMFVMMATGGLLVVAQAAPVAREWGISAAALTAALSLDRIANGLSRVSWGWLSDRVGREQTMFVAFTLHAGCLLSILWVGRQSGIAVHRDAGADVFHLGRGVLAISFHPRRLLRQRQRSFELQLPVHRQRRGGDHRRRSGGVVVREVRKLVGGVLWQRGAGADFGADGAGA